jgi:hypothetical protein
VTETALAVATSKATGRVIQDARIAVRQV